MIITVLLTVGLTGSVLYAVYHFHLKSRMRTEIRCGRGDGRRVRDTPFSSRRPMLTWTLPWALAVTNLCGSPAGARAQHAQHGMRDTHGMQIRLQQARHAPQHAH
jgi:hypothetical protein